MFRKLISTSSDSGALIARLFLGAVFFAHGAQKVFGWWGGGGFEGTMNSFTQNMGIPGVFAFLAIMAEFLGSIGLVIGFLGRIAAFGILCNMVVALFLVHLPNGFFMNWTGTQGGEGFEYHLLAIGLALSTIIRGSGALSIDHWLYDRLYRGHSSLVGPS